MSSESGRRSPYQQLRHCAKAEGLPVSKCEGLSAALRRQSGETASTDNTTETLTTTAATRTAGAATTSTMTILITATTNNTDTTTGLGYV